MLGVDLVERTQHLPLFCLDTELSHRLNMQACRQAWLLLEGLLCCQQSTHLHHGCLCLCRSEVSAGEAAIAQLERDLAAAQGKLSQAESKLAAAQEDAAEKDKVIK